jgi:hypothetical protein
MRSGRRALEPRGDAAVGKLGAIEDDRLIDVGSYHGAIGGNHHPHDVCQPFLTFAQRRETRRQLFR